MTTLRQIKDIATRAEATLLQDAVGLAAAYADWLAEPVQVVRMRRAA
mgnify:CR=1 FL=1